MTDDRLMRSETILALLARAGVKTAAVTAKDKLRRLLGRNLDGICFSSECADAEMEALVGRNRPDMYSADLSLFVLDAGIALLERGAAELLYLSLSDYVQHAHPPGAPEADSFNRALDDRVHRLVELGAVVGIVADHGMNDKAKPDGAPNVIFLEDELNDRFGIGSVHVICPITTPCAASRRSRIICPRIRARPGQYRGPDGGEWHAARGGAGARCRGSGAALSIAARSGSRFRRTR